MHRSPRIPALLAAAGLAILTACGGGDGTAKRTSSPRVGASGTASATPPMLSAAAVRSSLLPGKEIVSGSHPVQVSYHGMKQRAVPLCSESFVKPSGHPAITTRQFQWGPKDDPRGSFAQIALTYPDAASAASMFSTTRAKAKACPAQQHIRQERLPNQHYIPAHDYTWRTSEDTVSGWTHLRAIGTATYPQWTTPRPVIHNVFDYVTRGNVVIASAYWQSTEPGASGDAIVQAATTVLTKQVAKLG